MLSPILLSDNLKTNKETIPTRILPPIWMKLADPIS